MMASWTDSPRTGATYNVYILTNYRDPPSSAVHVKTGLTSMGLEIGNFNKDDFAPIGATVGNFPGFELGQMYRLYIEYYDSEGVQLNTGSELSEFATPMIKASPPLNVEPCGIVENAAPCDE